MRREITGFSNPLIKQVRSLREKKYRKREGLFLAEGLRIMTDAREAGFLPQMLFRFSGRESHPLERLVEDAVLEAGGDVIETSADILSKLSGKDNAQTVIGVYREHPVKLVELDRALRQSGWRRRPCVIQAISAQCCGPVMLSAQAD